MTQVDVKALAKLARLDVADDELAKLEEEIPAILGFVEQIQKVSAEIGHPTPEHHNVLRDDSNPHESGIHTRTLIDAAPGQKNDHIVVKQVISRKK